MEGPEISLKALLSNEPMWVALFAWLVAAVCKVLYYLVTERTFKAGRLFATGGMPSTHTAPVIALATTVGILYGFAHVNFTIVCTLAIVVMYDAANIRQEAGKHAEAINMLVEALTQNGGIKTEQWTRMKELLGHTYLEVGVGALIGFLVGIYGHQYWLMHWGQYPTI